ncbi:DUF2278 family protein [Rhizobium leguminosarum]|uniref:DUF2278 family protein n=1 Tax=Rhizobium leguminosarum TaxID=384 RepID=UPI00027D8B4F|nr:DUF2278 family protein [Rhizobium leguminosarum]RWY87145.1 DUF2278 family protein [Rhizobium leguminosarum]
MLKNYKVLKGTASALALDDDNDPHIEIRIEANGVSYRIALNVRSKESPHDLLYANIVDFKHPALTEALEALPMGLTDIRRERPELAIDYVRGGLIEREDMNVAPFQLSGPKNDLRDFIEPIVQEGIADSDVHFYAFGEAWGPEINKPDQYFRFEPGNGIHDIHMNQGDGGSFKATNGPNQDGALLVHFNDTDEWAAIFLCFQSQNWNTDAATGHPVSDSRGGQGRGEGTRRPQPIVASSLRIVAALINPVNGQGGTEAETVTIINRSDMEASLEGWKIEDENGRTQTLSGSLSAGELRTIALDAAAGGPQLANRGGDIILRNADGAVADRVGYGKSETANEGWTTIF